MLVVTNLNPNVHLIIWYSKTVIQIDEEASSFLQKISSQFIPLFLHYMTLIPIHKISWLIDSKTILGRTFKPIRALVAQKSYQYAHHDQNHCLTYLALNVPQKQKKNTHNPPHTKIPESPFCSIIPPTGIPRGRGKRAARAGN